MAGKFINKSYVNTIDALTKGTVTKVQNANYVFNDKPPVICTWYNINRDATTFDQATNAEYAPLSLKSPIRYNKIQDAVFYGNGIKIELSVEYEEDGLETPMPTFSGIVLPNTWIPYANDMIIIKHANQNWVYRVISVSFDTMDNGNNIYQFNAMLENIGTEVLEKLVVENYKMIINNVGTSFNAVIKEENYDCIDKLDTILSTMKDYYVSLFYNDAVQTFTYEGYYGNLYDPYMIEFLDRNNILSGSSEYIYVHHEVPVPRTFSIDYNDTCFRALETNSIDLFNNKKCVADIIEDQYSLFASVIDKYYMIKYVDYGFQMFQPLDAQLIYSVKNNVILNVDDEKSYYNIITGYFNHSELGSNMIPLIERIDFKRTPELFYAIPMMLFIIEDSIKKLMK